MNIEELFDNEIYHNYGMLTTEDANCLINYLKTETIEYIAGLEKRIVELETQVPKTVTSVDGKCPNCGGWCGWNYCQFCGSKLKWDDK